MEAECYVKNRRLLPVYQRHYQAHDQELDQHGEGAAHPLDAALQAALGMHNGMLSSAGIALKTDTPFDQDGERKNPWWGDPSYRILSKTATQADVRLYHLHIDPSYAEQDLNCLFPLQHLQEMETIGRIGRISPRHYSIMGYLLNPENLLCKTVPALIRNLKEDLADVVVLVPA